MFFCCGLCFVIGLLVSFFCLWDWYLVWSFSPLRFDLFLASCLLSSLSLSVFLLFGVFAGYVFLSLSLSLSLSGAGETQTILVWVSPCVLFFMAAIAHIDPYSAFRTYTKVSPRTCCLFFLFSSSSLVSGSVSSRPCSGGVGFLGGCFSLVSVLVSALRCMTDLGTCKWGRETRHLPPLRPVITIVVFGVWVRTSDPQKSLHNFLLNWSHPP